MQCDTTNLQDWPTLDVVNNRIQPDGRAGIVSAENSGASTTVNKNEKSKAAENKGGKKKNYFRKGKKMLLNTPSYRFERNNSASQNYQNSEYGESFNSNGSHNGENRSARGSRRGRGNRGNRFRGLNRHYQPKQTRDSHGVHELSCACSCCVPPKDVQIDLKHQVRNQIEYYFSQENLAADFYLRQKMDSYGYVPLSLIETFPKVMQLSQERSLIVEALKLSCKLEIRAEFWIRPVVDPLRWPIINSVIRNQAPELSTNEDLANHMSNLSIDSCPVQQLPGNSMYVVPFSPPDYIPPPVPIQSSVTNDIKESYCGDAPSSSSITNSCAACYDDVHLSCAVSQKLDSAVYAAEGPTSHVLNDYTGSPAELNYYSLPQGNNVIFFNNHNSGYYAYSIPPTIEGLSGDGDSFETISPEPTR